MKNAKHVSAPALCIGQGLGIGTLTWTIGIATLILAVLPSRAQMVAPDACSPLKSKKVLVLPGNGHDQPRIATLDNLKAFAAQIGFSIKADGDPLTLTDQVLNDYDIIVFNFFFDNDKQDRFPQSSKDAFMRWLKKGKKGYIGYHTSGANEWAANEWRGYQDSVTGMRYALHGAGTPSGTVTRTTDTSVLNQSIMKGLPATFTGEDEWYEYTMDSKIFDPAWNWKIMYHLTSVAAPRVPGPPNHPAAWFREDDLGTRFFYSLFIHTLEGANSAFFKSVLLRALEYSAGPSTCVTAVSAPGWAESGRPDLSLVTSGKSLRVELDGDYRLSVWSVNGQELYARHGSGRDVYQPDPFRNPGLYIVKIETASRQFTRKFMIY